MGPVIDYVATNHRPAAMILVVLPLSFLLRNVLMVRDYMYQHFIADATTAGHDKRIQRVISDVKKRVTERIDSKGDRKLCTARAPWQNLSTRFADYKKNSDCIFVGDFRNVRSYHRRFGLCRRYDDRQSQIWLVARNSRR